MDPRSGHPAGVDGALEVELGVGVVAPGGPDRRHARPEVELGGRLGRLDAASGRRVERVVLEPDEAGDHSVAGEVQDLGARGDLHVLADRLDPSVADHDGRIRQRRGARAVDDLHAGQRDHGRVHLHVLRDRLGQHLARLRTCRGGQRGDPRGCQQRERRSPHRVLLRVGRPRPGERRSSLTPQ